MAEDCMELESSENENKSDVGNAEFILDHLITCKDVFYKSQQRGEKDLCANEKKEIAAKIFLKSKANFLSRFGKHLSEKHLSYFEQYTDDAVEGYDIVFYLDKFRKNIKMKKNEVKNRRYSALTQLVDGKSYFSETEMMRRNPLLYDQLVGQYLSEDERKERDNLDTKNITFVNLLLEGIDRDYVKMRKKQQQEDEDNAMEEDDDDEPEDEKDMVQDNTDDEWNEEQPSTSKWGEYDDDKNTPSNSQNYTPFSRLSQRDNIPSPSKNIIMITATERRLLKDEFISLMYQNFLDGKDADFDYESVDNNEEYDNLNIKTHDAEDKYFDSESPENVTPGERKMSTENTDTSEDELDVFMNRLNQQQAIKKLTQDISHL